MGKNHASQYANFGSLHAYPSAGMPMGRAFAEWLKDLKEK